MIRFAVQLMLSGMLQTVYNLTALVIGGIYFLSGRWRTQKSVIREGGGISAR